jgi:hypothetical protein
LAKGDVNAARIMSMLLKNRSRSESLGPGLRRDDEWWKVGEEKQDAALRRSVHFKYRSRTKSLGPGLRRDDEWWKVGEEKQGSCCFGFAAQEAQ